MSISAEREFFSIMVERSCFGKGVIEWQVKGTSKGIVTYRCGLNSTGMEFEVVSCSDVDVGIGVGDGADPGKFNGIDAAFVWAARRHGWIVILISAGLGCT